MEVQRIVPVGRVPIRQYYFDLLEVLLYSNCECLFQSIELIQFSYWSGQALLDVFSKLEAELDVLVICTPFVPSTTNSVTVQKCTLSKVADKHSDIVWFWKDHWWQFVLQKLCEELCAADPHGIPGPSVWLCC